MYMTVGLKIGDVSKTSGVGIETLRFYEKIGLLERPQRTGSGYRIYDGEILERLSFIRKSQALGFSLDEIRELIEHKRGGENPCKHVRSKVKTRLEEIDERLKQLTRYRNELRKALAEWEKVGESKGHVCGLIESADIKGVKK
jgi:MerR family transcriptional regulator, copper efflux regulator